MAEPRVPGVCRACRARVCRPCCTAQPSRSKKGPGFQGESLDFTLWVVENLCVWQTAAEMTDLLTLLWKHGGFHEGNGFERKDRSLGPEGWVALLTQCHAVSARRLSTENDHWLYQQVSVSLDFSYNSFFEI